MKLSQGLRYGENPHQSAAFYTDASLAENDMGGVATSVRGRPLPLCLARLSLMAGEPARAE